MDKAARLAMMPDYEMYCVDLTEGVANFACLIHCGILLKCLLISYNT